MFYSSKVMSSLGRGLQRERAGERVFNEGGHENCDSGRTEHKHRVNLM